MANMKKIQDVENPQIGDFFMVRCVRIQRGSPNKGFWFPVVDNPHRDGKYGLDTPHYHIDWRFVSDGNIMDQRNYYRSAGIETGVQETEYIAPVLEEEVIEERYLPLRYQRDHSFPEITAFDKLKEAMKDSVMQNLTCPHHKTSLKSCKAVDGVLTCPQHGLKWNIKTGKQVI